MFTPRGLVLTVVVPGVRLFPWSMREAWQVLLKKAKVRFRWVSHHEGRPETTIRTLGKQDVVLLLNDHHLEDLTRYLGTTESHGRGRDERIWLGLSTERVVGSPFPKSEDKTRACARLCHLVAHFDPAAGGLIRGEGAEPYFCHQYASTDLFIPRKAWTNKENRIFWSGKLSVGNFADAYSQRKTLFAAFQKAPGVVWRDAAQKNEKLDAVLSEKDSYKGLLNLPSNCPGYTANFFENLAMGGCTLQHRMSSPMPIGLAEGETHLGYDLGCPDSFKEACARFLRAPDDFQKIAQQGRVACLQYHTLWHRAVEIFRALQTSLEKQGSNLAAGKVLSEAIAKLEVAQ